MSELNDSHMVGNGTLQGLDLRFYEQKEFSILSIHDKRRRDVGESLIQKGLNSLKKKIFQ